MLTSKVPVSKSSLSKDPVLQSHLGKHLVKSVGRVQLAAPRRGSQCHMWRCPRLTLLGHWAPSSRCYPGLARVSTAEWTREQLHLSWPQDSILVQNACVVLFPYSAFPESLEESPCVSGLYPNFHCQDEVRTALPTVTLKKKGSFCVLLIYLQTLF